MSTSVNRKFAKYFHPKEICNAFRKYEEAKRDAFDESIIDVPMGADGISYSTFSKELDLRCQLISNRVIKGSYQFYPFREVKVPKSSGGGRVLSIATIRDVLVQKILYEVIYPEFLTSSWKVRKKERI